MTWEFLINAEQLDTIVEESSVQPIVIFKHSTSCSISKMAMMRYEDGNDLNFKSYYLDLLSYRSVSDEISERFQVYHESPQLILVHKGEAIYDASHFDISVDEVKETLEYHKIPLSN